MTLEKQYVIEFNDILAFRISCEDCGASLSIPVGKTEYTPDECPYCRKRWFKRDEKDYLHEIESCMDIIAKLIRRDQKTLCHVRLEVELDDKPEKGV